MEEILASIRRIIADDQAFLSSRAPAEPPPAVMPLQTHDEPRRAWTPPPPRADVNVAAPHPIQPVPAAAPVSVQPSLVPQAAPAAHWPPGVLAAEPQRAEAPPVLPPDEAPEPEPNPVEPPEAETYDESVSDEMTAVPASTDAADMPLISASTDASVSAAFNALLASRFLDSPEHLNELVRECLRPMLKAWLDDNLPILVERLVRAEIERVARGGR
jgi:cell pole-organizing protein PopZ